jgi:uroporphyrinogen III methyltransferase/synthase
MRPRVALTRAQGGSDQLAGRLRDLGLEVVECPLIRIEPLAGEPIRLEEYAWLVLTSANAVAPLLGRAVGALPGIAVIGPGTAAALREHGIEPALVADESTQEGLVASLRAATGGDPGRVLFAGAEGARDVIARELSADVVPLYRTVEEAVQEFPEVDLVVLGSGSAARAFARLQRDTPCVSIGPATSAVARALGLRVVAEAERHDLGGLVDAVRLAASRLS